MAKSTKAYLLRISPELWDALNRWASHELRSVNAQIEYVLREAVRKRRGERADAESKEQTPPIHAERPGRQGGEAPGAEA
jgi:hypothetical protein